MTYVFRAHSGLRYVILAVAVVAVVVFAVGLLRRRPFGRFPRALGSAYAGLVHLQVTLGLVLVALGRFSPRLLGHAVTMVAVAVSLQVLLSLNQRRTEPTYGRPLAGVLLSLVGFAVGLAAIGRGLLEATAFAAPPAG